jgi:hypothetical protein
MFSSKEGGTCIDDLTACQFLKDEFTQLVD